MIAPLLAGEDFHPRHLVFMIGPAIGVTLGYGLKWLLGRMGIHKLATSLAVIVVFFGATALWTVFVLNTLWPIE